MADNTENLGLKKPVIDVEANWGIRWNENADILDDSMLLANVSGTGTVTVIDNGGGNITISGGALSGTLASVEDDTSPTLGGALDCADFFVTNAGRFRTGSPGFASSAAYSFDADSQTGMYRKDFGVIAFTTANSERVTISGVGVGINGNLTVTGDIAGVLTQVVEDTSPTLGGNLAAGTNNITGVNRIFVEDGAAATPGFAFTDDTNVGIFRPLNNHIALAVENAAKLTVSGLGTKIVGTLEVTGNITGAVDHGTANGLTDDDHPQYFNATRADAVYLHEALIGFDGVTVESGTNRVTISGFRQEFLSTSGTLQTDIDTRLTDVTGEDHGTLTGLTDDDHTQYVLAAGGRDIVGNQVIGGNLTVSGSLIDVNQQLDMHVPEPTAGDSIAIRGYAFYAFDIESMWAENEVANCVVSVKINGTDVTGLASVAVSTTGGVSAASASNSVAIGDKVTVVIDSADSTATGLTVALNASRTS